jgi:hypothetical protein
LITGPAAGSDGVVFLSVAKADLDDAQRID